MNKQYQESFNINMDNKHKWKETAARAQINLYIDLQFKKQYAGYPQPKTTKYK